MSTSQYQSHPIKKTLQNMRKDIFHCIVFAFMALTMTSCGGDDGLNKTSVPTDTYDQDEDETPAVIGDDYVYQLPVIFHVLYKDEKDKTQYVDAARFKTILNNVNELYQGNVYGQSEDIKVRFVLAQQDENGNNLDTPGVRYVKWTESYPIAPKEFMGDNSGKNAKYIWDPNDYINVMVYNFKDTDNSSTLLGLSHTPYTISNNQELEGLHPINTTYISKSLIKFPYSLSINSTYINSESSRYTIDKRKTTYTYQPEDINTTLAHELGHYLGLFHAFSEEDGETSDNCKDTDYCKDTPSYNRVEYNDYLTNYISNIIFPSQFKLADLIRRTNCDNLTFISTNIMDYDMGHSNQFTPEQKQRMRHVLYYSPLIPGPKKNGANKNNRRNMPSRSGANEQPLDLPIHFTVCETTPLKVVK
ncbi:MAG: zinc-dependent metalloproteinase lipoprotein [Prevotellaceae bacterium]|nr:zinc-dependent metalloproteinase lipoprotein [Prevotellaceae bacterium]MDY3365107.1 zinc-dependent metalloproteinase lipoprotein [Prevotella sp.]